jgi:putative transcriptional regulator
MPIDLMLDMMPARRNMRSGDLDERNGVTEHNLSLRKSGKVNGERFDTLAGICDALYCQPGDPLEFLPEGEG